METLTHIKVYGHGAADVLKQHAIEAKFVDGNLVIILDKLNTLVIACGDSKLRFYIESRE